MGADNFVTRSVVILLGCGFLIGLLGVIWLIDRKVPAASLTIVAGLTGTALGSLGTLLARTGSADTPQQVQIVPPVEPAE